MDTNTRVGVLMGGCSSERDVSFKSGKAVCQALIDSGFEAVAIDVSSEDQDYVKDLILSYNIGLAFLALHGGFGEDGRIQGILESLGLAYTGSGPKASSLAMDKISAYRIFEANGLRVPRSRALDKRHRGLRQFKDFPLVVKPQNGGSSIGLSIVDTPGELKKAVELAFEYDSRVIVEEYIEGSEMTVGILDDKALPVIQIKPDERCFDYKAKYESRATKYIVPADIAKSEARLLQDAGIKAHKALGCAFFSRVDIILSRQSHPVVLEVNTIPGFTARSLLPMAAACAGMVFKDVVLKITADAFMRRPQKKVLYKTISV